ncbi:MAG: H-X9-DG-CTERM domain-containing protein [Armatimonadota bacterium]
MTADLASPKDSKPYVDDAGSNDPSVAASTVDKTRHNNGAVFTFVDGHVSWLSKEKITPFLFLPAVDPEGFWIPVAVGALYDGVLPYASSDGVTKLDKERQPLSDVGITTAVGVGPSGGSNLCFNNGTKAIQYPVDSTAHTIGTSSNWGPSGSGDDPTLAWWQLGANGCLVYPNYAWSTLSWGGSSFTYAPCALADASPSGFTAVLTIVPNTTNVKTDTMKKMAMIVNNLQWTCTATGTVNWIKVYNKTGALVQTANLNSAITLPNSLCGTVANGFLLPVHPGCKLEISYTITSNGNGGMTLAFEP